MMKGATTSTTLVLAITAALLAGCGEDTGKLSQARKAEEIAKTIVFTDNAEIDNIKRRIELTSKPGLLGYIAIVNKVGQVTLYTPVMGKVTSGKKRLTQPFSTAACGTDKTCTTPSPSDEGTWGESADYVYFWAPSGQYFQTNMEYVYSDKPFRPASEPLLVIQAPEEARRAETGDTRKR